MSTLSKEEQTANMGASGAGSAQDATSRIPASSATSPWPTPTEGLAFALRTWDDFPTLEHETLPSPRPPQIAPPGQEYVDPFLFETGHFESREEYEELSRTAKIKRRARA